MKKTFSFMLSIFFGIVAYLLVSNSGEIYNSYKEKSAVNEDKPSQEQIEEFEAKTRDKCFYYYENLPDDDKDAYLTLYYGFISYDDSIFFENTKSDIKDIITAVLYDNPEIFWVDYKYEYSISDKTTLFSPDYRLTDDEVDKMQVSIDKKIDEIMSVVNTLATDYEKELYIHDIIIENTQYDISTLNNMGDTVYSVLVSGKSICEGYARATQILLDKAGIKNYLITGESKTEEKNEPHMWNIVNIDGENYHLDTTWDDLNDEIDTVYFYFNVTDAYISRDHTILNPTNNMCNSEKANYFVKENAIIYTYNGFSGHINRSAKALSDGKNEVMFYFVNHSDYVKALNDLEKDNGFFKYVYSTVKKSNKNYKTNTVDYNTAEDYNYLSVVFKEG